MKKHLLHPSHLMQATPAEVAYVLASAYDVAHFGPVCRELNERGIGSYFVLRKPATWHRSSSKRKEKLDHYERLRELLASNGLPFAGKLNPYADVAITTQSADCLRACRNTKLKAPYGAPAIKEDTQYLPEKCEGFDGFLVHGQLQKNTHTADFPASRMKIIGIPKYDAFFQSPPDRRAIKNRLGIPTEQAKPIITYLPTWDIRNSTIYSFHAAFLRLSDECTIVIKPHPHTQKLNFKTSEVDKLGRITPHVLDACEPTEDAVAIADLLITDVKSGVTTESMYLTQGETPWIGITPHPESVFFDVIIAAGPVVQDPHSLPQAVAEIFTADPYRQARGRLIRYAYSDNAGHAAEDAADAIVQFAQMSVITRRFPYAWNKLSRSIRKRADRLQTTLGIGSNEISQ